MPGDDLIRYRFTFDDQRCHAFEVRAGTDLSPEDPARDYPAWLALERDRCEGCPLPPGSRRTCPAALSIEAVVASFASCVSWERVALVVERGGQRLEASLPIQVAARSLMGLLLPLSACPVMMQLRPMAYLHLPLGGHLDTLFRFLGMYLIAQYLRGQDGHAPDWELSRLRELMGEIHRVNRGLAQRLRHATTRDAAVNSVILLDALTDSLELSLLDSLEDLRPLFAVYLRG